MAGKRSRDQKGLKGPRRASKDFGAPTVGVHRIELKGIQETWEGLRGQGGPERQPDALYRASRVCLLTKVSWEGLGGQRK